MRAPEVKRNLKIAISLAYYMGRGVLHSLLRLVGRSDRERLTVLYYHGILPEQRLGFHRQMATLQRWARVVPASFRGKLGSGKKCVAITFDDALISLLENALPQLENYSFHATVFVPTGWLGRTPGWSMKESEPAFAKTINPELADVVMSPGQLKSLNTALVSLGSHSVMHPSMLEIDAKRARQEIEDSRRQLREMTGLQISEFSFPYGEYDASNVEMCRAAGYEAVYSIEARGVDTTSNEILRGRTKVDPTDSPLEFFLKFQGAYEWMSSTAAARKRLRSSHARQPSGVGVQPGGQDAL
jgi:peptidoglycan/xylan/chitin deacetylase (PgdA/CDA1 family)